MSKSQILSYNCSILPTPHSLVSLPMTKFRGKVLVEVFGRPFQSEVLDDICSKEQKKSVTTLPYVTTEL